MNAPDTQTQRRWHVPGLDREWPWGLLLFLVVVTAYLPVWQARYVWDDDILLTANPSIIGPLGLKEIWTTHIANICPLVLTTFWAEHALWGLDPLPYHLVNVLFHGICAILLWRVLLALRIPGAWLGAALWALHPVQTESAAWITEMKNTESGLFYLLTILCFIRWLNSGKPVLYAAMLLLSTLAMTSKPSTVILPLVLCLCAWWMEGRWQWRNLLRVVPLFPLVLASAALSLWIQKVERPLDQVDPQTVLQRLLTSADAVWFQLGKLLWPHPLIAVYTHWHIDVSQPVNYLPLLALIILCIVLWLKRTTWGRPYFFTLAYFIAALLPTLDFVNMNFFAMSYVADHFQYLASMGPLALAGAGLARLGHSLLPTNARLQATLAASLLIILGVLSWRQAALYQNHETLWRDTLAKNPGVWVGYNDLAIALVYQGRLDEAIPLFRKALEIRPNDGDAQLNLAAALARTGQYDAAIAQYRSFLSANPNHARAHNDLGTSLLAQGQLDQAAAEFQTAIQLDPRYADPYDNLGHLYLQKGQVKEAILSYHKATDLSSGNTTICSDLALAFLQDGQVANAITQLRHAEELAPDSAPIHFNLGMVYSQAGQFDTAIAEYEATLQLDPNNSRASYNIGVILLRTGHQDLAIAQFEKALLINPNNAEARNNLGVAFLGVNQPELALGQFQEAIRLKPDYTEAHNNLARVQTILKASPPAAPHK